MRPAAEGRGWLSSGTSEGNRASLSPALNWIHVSNIPLGAELEFQWDASECRHFGRDAYVVLRRWKHLKGSVIRPVAGERLRGNANSGFRTSYSPEIGIITYGSFG